MFHFWIKDTQMAPSLLMVEPDYYKIEYAINPFMLDENGKLKQVDGAKAKEQWAALVEVYKSLGVKVHTLKARPELPDMVYAANNALVFFNPQTGKKTAVMAKMKSPFRRPEVPFFEKWYLENGYDVLHLEKFTGSFEGCGDALIQHKRTSPIVWGGYGQRTDKSVYYELIDRFNFHVITLELVHPDFYHLDTCFAILKEDDRGHSRGLPLRKRT